ncbi:hypothetical protein JCM3774_002462 [Rhodotorula dairenensis]
MLICLVGPPQAGKESLAEHLVAEHGYERVHLASSTRTGPRSGARSVYASSSEFLDHATRTWRRNYVTTDLVSKAKLVEFAKRPFVAIVAVDAPLGVRFKRAVAAARERREPEPSLEDFVARDDLLYHGTLPLLATAAASAAFAQDASTQPDPATPNKVRSLGPGADAPPSPSPSPARQITPIPSPELVRNHAAANSAPRPSGSSAAAAASGHAPPVDATLAAILPLAHLTLPNPYPSLAPFLSSFSIPILSELLRPSWDTYFMLLASLASLRSNCMKRRVGAVLVREKRVVSTGYNGTPRGVRNCGEGGCGRCNSHGDGWGDAEDALPPAIQDDVFAASANGPPTCGSSAKLRTPAKNLSRVGEALDECLCLHAEENALLEAGRERVSGGGTEGAVLYCNTCPCLRCTVKIVQCGVKEVVYSLSYSMDTASRRVMEEAGVVLRQIPQPAFPR